MTHFLSCKQHALETTFWKNNLFLRIRISFSKLFVANTQDEVIYLENTGSFYYFKMLTHTTIHSAKVNKNHAISISGVAPTKSLSFQKS